MSNPKDEFLKHLSVLKIKSEDLEKLCDVLASKTEFQTASELRRIPKERKDDDDDDDDDDNDDDEDSNEILDETSLLDKLEDNGIPSKVRRELRKWLKEEREAPSDVPEAHFYKLSKFLNFGDSENNDDNDNHHLHYNKDSVVTVAVDILEEKGEENDLPPYSLQVPYGAIDRQVQLAADSYVPIVSMVGPTGVGKSFLSSTFMSRGEDDRGNWPVVASPSQAEPTSANVSCHRGWIHPGRTTTDRSDPIVLIDFEGEDGRTPKNLGEEGYQKFLDFQSMSSMFSGIRSGLINSAFEDVQNQRSKVVKKVLPPLAYLLSDVVVFIDTVELRRTERHDRIREFAESAYKSVETMLWRPALVIVQNKWIRLSENSEDVDLDVTDIYKWAAEGLSKVFSEVRLVRIPSMNDKHWFETGLHTFHDNIKLCLAMVQEERKQRSALYSERLFWFNFNAMVKQFHSKRGGGYIEDLNSIVSSNKVSRNNPADNALSVLKIVGGGSLPKTGHQFTKVLECTFKWYAYSLAGEVQCHCRDVDDMQESLPAVYETIVKLCRTCEPCGAVYFHDGKKYACSQRRDGHGQSHRNPTMLSKRSENFFKMAIGFGYWKDSVPCVWDGEFEPSDRIMSLDTFRRNFNLYAKLDKAKYENIRFPDVPAGAFTDAEKDGLCPLCLRAGRDLILLPCKNRHPICDDCITKRVTLSEVQDELVCPFCDRESRESRCNVAKEKIQHGGLRMLSLDGGGVRGLIEIIILKQLQERFKPLKINQLFDVIVGTSAGGIVAMALLTDVPLSKIEEVVERMAKEILDVDTFTKAYRAVTSQPICDSEAMDRAMCDVFGDSEFRKYRNVKPPYVFCTAFQAEGEELWLFGNFPRQWKKSEKFFSSHVPPIWQAARATSAAPIFFAPTEFRASLSSLRGSFVHGSQEEELAQKTELVDGGVTANCPAKAGVNFIRECGSDIQGNGKHFPEMIVSLGTGKAKQDGGTSGGGGVLSWSMKMIDLAVNAEISWQNDILDDLQLQNVPKVRINPPDLGSVDAFASDSVKLIRDGMDHYFTTVEGKTLMNDLLNMVFANLWELPLYTSAVAGEEKKLKIKLRDGLFDFSSIDDTSHLYEIIRSRSDDEVEEHHDLELLREEARFACLRKPLVNPLEGQFVFIVKGKETILEPGERVIKFFQKHSGTYESNVVWRSHGSPDYSIGGFPKSIHVIGEKDGK